MGFLVRNEVTDYLMSLVTAWHVCFQVKCTLKRILHHLWSVRISATFIKERLHFIVWVEFQLGVFTFFLL